MGHVQSSVKHEPSPYDQTDMSLDALDPHDDTVTWLHVSFHDFIPGAGTFRNDVGDVVLVFDCGVVVTVGWKINSQTFAKDKTYQTPAIKTRAITTIVLIRESDILVVVYADWTAAWSAGKFA